MTCARILNFLLCRSGSQVSPVLPAVPQLVEPAPAPINTQEAVGSTTVLDPVFQGQLQIFADQRNIMRQHRQITRVERQQRNAESQQTDIQRSHSAPDPVLQGQLELFFAQQRRKTKLRQQLQNPQAVVKRLQEGHQQLQDIPLIKFSKKA